MPQYSVYAQQVLYVERVINAPDEEAAATIADQLVQSGMLLPVNSVEFENGVLCEVVEADVPTKETLPTSTLLDVFGEPPSDAPAFGENKLDFLAKSRLNAILFATEPRKIGKTWWVYAVYNSAFFPGGNATEMQQFPESCYPNPGSEILHRSHQGEDFHPQGSGVTLVAAVSQCAPTDSPGSDDSGGRLFPTDQGNVPALSGAARQNR